MNTDNTDAVGDCTRLLEDTYLLTTQALRVRASIMDRPWDDRVQHHIAEGLHHAARICRLTLYDLMPEETRDLAHDDPEDWSDNVRLYQTWHIVQTIALDPSIADRVPELDGIAVKRSSGDGPDRDLCLAAKGRLDGLPMGNLLRVHSDVIRDARLETTLGPRS